jgi:glyoxylase-like metal-dependent hydrolase (beta-lactamase superfamily II)
MNDTDDWFEVTRFGPGSHQISEGRGVLQCNSFVLSAEDETLLLDTGLGIGNLPAVVDELASGDVSVLLSHAHWDHIGHAHSFDDVRIHESEWPADSILTIDSMTDEFVDRPEQFVRGWLDSGKSFPESFDPERYAIRPTPDVRPIDEGETVTVGDRELELLPIPGHSPGQLAVLDRHERVCYAADVLEPGWKVYAHFAHSDVEAYRDSVARLRAAWNEGAFDTLALSHGDAIQGEDLELLTETLKALNAIIAEELDHERVDTPWGPVSEYETSTVRILTSP